MKLSLEGQMQPIWAGQQSHMSWRPRSPDLEAVGAWVEVHIRRPDLNLGEREFDAAVARGGRQGGPPRVRTAPTAAFEGVIGRQRARRMRRGARRGGWEEMLKKAELTARQREVLELAQRMTNEEGRPDYPGIGREMVPPVSSSTARVHLERAREKVREGLLAAT